MSAITQLVFMIMDSCCQLDVLKVHTSSIEGGAPCRIVPFTTQQLMSQQSGTIYVCFSKNSSRLLWLHYTLSGYVRIRVGW